MHPYLEACLELLVMLAWFDSAVPSRVLSRCRVTVVVGLQCDVVAILRYVDASSLFTFLASREYLPSLAFLLIAYV